jgi:predicted alpha/beta hydrolase family esterase
MVAPPDLGAPELRQNTLGFDASLEGSLPCPSRVVASRNDPYSPLEFARELAKQWESSWADIGDKGHINADSGLGAWPEGRIQLSLLEDQILASGK